MVATKCETGRGSGKQNVLTKYMLEVSPLGVGMVLRLERDYAW